MLFSSLGDRDPQYTRSWMKLRINIVICLLINLFIISIDLILISMSKS